MSPTFMTPPPPGQNLPRKLYLEVLRVAILKGEFLFARECALTWLANFPGDLMVSLVYAQSLIGENHPQQALPFLEKLCQLDPEFQLAQETHLVARNACGFSILPETKAILRALGNLELAEEKNSNWGNHLWMTRKALLEKNYDQAEKTIQLCLAINPTPPIVAVTHLELLEASGNTPLRAKRNLAEHYHKLWLDCLPCTLFLADWLMDGGESDKAVALLHEVSVRDVGDQIATRLWGVGHPYRSIWPERLELPLKTTIPGSVSASLGWNRLAPGHATPVKEENRPFPVEITTQPPDQAYSLKAIHETVADLKAIDQDNQESRNLADIREEDTPEEQSPETLQSVQAELERLAERINRRGLTRLDGRFPIYVVFSVRSKLLAYYGPEATQNLENEMHLLVETIGRLPGWGARLFLADDPMNTSSLGIKPAKPGDPWELKLALADLDTILRKRGEMIGAVLIVGGPEIVPFHHLPNPVDDEDLDVASDNPYTTRDENYFIPEWPVGRLPGGASPDASVILNAIKDIRNHHANQISSVRWYLRWWGRLISWLHIRHQNGRPSMGYTAAVWRMASLSVFRPIGDPRAMLVSPPLGINGSAKADPVVSLNIPFARLGYFNLHGLADAAEWYGQRDPTDSTEETDYPIAIRPQDIGVNGVTNQTASPQVIFTEACYGCHILGKGIQEAMALKFLASGSMAVIGSTGMAYGSVSSPLISADLLGFAFWHYLREGLATGEALKRAKLYLAREMNDRQGYLDGEDQKTLISFVLYGDPLYRPYDHSRKEKKVIRPIKPPLQVKTVCDRSGNTIKIEPIPHETLKYIKHIVSQYLPGMEDAQMRISHEHAECQATGHKCPTSQLKKKLSPESLPERQLVILSKQVQQAGHMHPQYARLTLDSQGKMVKLVVSR